MAPGSPLGRQSGASWDSAGLFRFLFAIGGPGAGPSRDRPAEGRRDDIDAARQRLAGWRGSKL